MATHLEKSEVLHDEDQRSDPESNEQYTPKEAAKIRRRIDYRLIPALGAMYGISLMDRKNVSNAAIAGMTKDLQLGIGYRYRYVHDAAHYKFLTWLTTIA
jgi:hypothetical protein